MIVTDKQINPFNNYESKQNFFEHPAFDLTIKITAVAATIFFGAAFGVLTAATGGADLLLLAGAGAAGGAVVGLAGLLFYTLFFDYEKQDKIAVSKPKPAILHKPQPPIEKKIDQVADLLKTHDLAKTSFTDQELDQILDKVDALLNEIKASAAKDLPLQDNFVENQFHVDTIMKSLPENLKQERRLKLQKILAQAYINRELKQKGKVRGSKEESQFLTKLGYTLDANSPYHNIDLIYDALHQFVSQELQTDNFSGSLKSVQNSFKQCALKARLSTLKITSEDQLQKFQSGLKFYESLKKNLRTELIDVKLKFPEDFPLKSPSQGIRLIESLYRQDKTQALNTAVKKILDAMNIQKIFSDPNVDHTAFEAMLILPIPDGELKKEFSEKELSKEIKKELAFYSKWGKNIKAELIQGLEDKNEALGKGVCEGICQRILTLGQKNPDITPEELAKHIHIESKDRFNQGVYIMSHILEKDKIPDLILKKNGFKQDENIFAFYYKAEDGIKYDNLKTDELKKSAGWVDVGLDMEESGHAILMRLDPTRGRAWLFDPNVGFLCFEEKGKTYQDAKNACFAFVKDLIELNYPTTRIVYGKHLVPDTK